MAWYDGHVSEGDTELVTATVISREFAIPRATLYRLVAAGKVPARDVTQAWHQKRRYLFSRSEVRAALSDMDRRPRPAAE